MTSLANYLVIQPHALKNTNTGYGFQRCDGRSNHKRISEDLQWHYFPAYVVCVCVCICVCVQSNQNADLIRAFTP